MNSEAPDWCVMSHDDCVLSHDGWRVVKADWGEYGNETIIWAMHYPCNGREGQIYRGKKRYGDWFPRDNAIVGMCCYCGDPVPEDMVVLFKLYNWDHLKDWEPGALKRAEERTTKQHISEV